MFNSNKGPNNNDCSELKYLCISQDVYLRENCASESCICNLSHKISRYYKYFFSKDDITNIFFQKMILPNNFQLNIYLCCDVAVADKITTIHTVQAKDRQIFVFYRYYSEHIA